MGVIGRVYDVLSGKLLLFSIRNEFQQDHNNEKDLMIRRKCFGEGVSIC